MPTVKDFEDLQIWKEARVFCREIYTTFSENRDFGFKEQIQRASVSIMNNIAEGFERESDIEFNRFLGIAKASAGEVRSMIYLASDLHYIDLKTKEVLIDSNKKISIGIYKLMKYLQNSKK